MFWFVTDHENSRHRNHVAGAFYDFLLGFCLSYKMHYVSSMLVVYFKNDNTSFREQRLSLTDDFSRTCLLEAKNKKKIRVLYFLEV